MEDHNARASQDETRRRHHQRYLHPRDGRLMPLVVQSFDDPHLLPNTSSWTRMGKPASRVPSLFKVAYWIGSSTTQEGTNERVHTPKALAIAAARLAVASPLVYCLMSCLDWGIPLLDQKSMKSTSKFELDLRYDGVFSRNPMVDQTIQSNPDHVAREESDGSQQRPYVSNIRLNSHVTPRRTGMDLSAPWVSRTDSAGLTLRPRYLCFIEDFKEGKYETVQVQDYIVEHGEQADTEFIFVSYTRMQFRVATDEEIDAHNYPNEETREANRKVAKEDRGMLIRWAIDAAKTAGKRAFWLDFECVRDKDGQARSTSSSEDVYRICDIVRASHSMIIGIGPPADGRVSAVLGGKDAMAREVSEWNTWLRQWGSRLWTLPELLLCPSEYRIKLYVSGNPDEPRELAKRNFAERAWEDAETVKDLVNHYEGSAILSPLLLIGTALECFSKRKTDQFSQGDIAYAIMGLLPDRQRPEVVRADTGFQAFARLSLAHDDGRFLERLICLLPPRQGAKWFDTDDLWGARLKDVLPMCRVVENGGSDSIILDGVSGATIVWDGVDGNASTSLLHKTAFLVLLAGFTFCVFLPKAWQLLLMFALKMQGGESRGEINNVFARVAANILFAPFIFAIIGPILVLWRAKEATRLNNSKPKLIGIEGFVDKARVERYIWGFNFGHLAQTSNIPLYQDTEGRPLNQQHEENGLAFTLVDTLSLTVTHFRASRPPVAMFVCGQEGGMQRALLCSYDDESNTYCRETILKVHNRVLDKMRRVDRFRFALDYPQSQDSEDSDPTVSIDDIAVKSEGIDGASEQVLDDGKWPLKLEWAFFVVTLLAYQTFENFDYLSSTSLSPGDTTVPYNISFIFTQLPIHFLLSRVSFSRIVPRLAIFKGFLVCYRVVFLHWRDPTATIVSYALLEGLTDSAFITVFIEFTWSWFSLARLPVRMLIWACGPMVVMGLWIVTAGQIGRLVFAWESLAPFFQVGLYFYISIWGSNLIATPNEISWLAAHKRVLYKRRSAAYKWETQGEASERRQTKHALLSSPQPWIFLLANLLNSAGTPLALEAKDWVFLNALEAVSMLTIFTVVLLKYPQATPLMVVVSLMISLITLGVIYLTHSSLDLMISRAQTLAAPLLWALIVPMTATRTDGHWSLTFSMMGLGAGRLLRNLGLGVAWMAPLLLLESLLVGCTWVIQRRRETQAARLFRASTIGEEYRDDVVDGI